MGAIHREHRPTEVADVAELYGELSKPLQRIVRRGVRAPAPLIEDACQLAWAELVNQPERVRPTTTLPWLVKTARHEAFRLIRRDTRDCSLETTLETEGESCIGLSSPGPDELALAHERLGQLERLSARQQRMMWLHGFGFSYAEMARRTGDTPRTIERQLLRAKRAVRGFELE